jgi:hypothetical protein
VNGVLTAARQGKQPPENDQTKILAKTDYLTAAIYEAEARQTGDNAGEARNKPRRGGILKLEGRGYPSVRAAFLGMRKDCVRVKAPGGAYWHFDNGLNFSIESRRIFLSQLPLFQTDKKAPSLTPPAAYADFSQGTLASGWFGGDTPLQYLLGPLSGMMNMGVRSVMFALQEVDAKQYTVSLRIDAVNASAARAIGSMIAIATRAAARNEEADGFLGILSGAKTRIEGGVLFITSEPLGMKEVSGLFLPFLLYLAL